MGVARSGAGRRAVRTGRLDTGPRSDWRSRRGVPWVLEDGTASCGCSGRCGRRSPRALGRRHGAPTRRGRSGHRAGGLRGGAVGRLLYRGGRRGVLRGRPHRRRTGARCRSRHLRRLPGLWPMAGVRRVGVGGRGRPTAGAVDRGSRLRGWPADCRRLRLAQHALGAGLRVAGPHANEGAGRRARALPGGGPSRVRGAHGRGGRSRGAHDGCRHTQPLLRRPEESEVSQVPQGARTCLGADEGAGAGENRSSDREGEHRGPAADDGEGTVDDDDDDRAPVGGTAAKLHTGNRRQLR